MRPKRVYCTAARYRCGRGWFASCVVALALVATTGCAIPGPDTAVPADESSSPAAPASTASTAPVGRAPRTGPLTPLDAERISAAQRSAIEALGDSGAVEPSGSHAHGHGVLSSTIEVPLLTGDAATFNDQWMRAQRATTRFDTVDELGRAGFVRASAPGPGVGTHWVRWTQVAAPFDPAEPSMVLLDETVEPPRLVAFVYWLQWPVEPIGFAGGNDHWHQHTGLCVVNGWVDREEAGGPDRCAGTYLAGGDLWMLHAWVVPGFENRLGRFANVHPALCPSRYGTPDIARCPDV
ncbi:MAG: hypothetical protein U0Q03_18875 [Acidimicrobiales bacterium]